MLLAQRDIFAVAYGLRKICFIVALVFEQIFRKSLSTFGKKSLIVSQATSLPSFTPHSRITIS